MEEKQYLLKTKLIKKIKDVVDEVFQDENSYEEEDAFRNFTNSEKNYIDENVECSPNGRYYHLSSSLLIFY